MDIILYIYSSVISIHFLMELFVKICLKIKKKLKACLNYLFKKMSLSISLVVLFIMKIRFFPGKSIANIKPLLKHEHRSVKIKINFLETPEQINLKP